MREYTDIYSVVVAFEVEKGVLRYIGRMYFYELVKKYNKRLKKDDDMLQGSVKISNTCFAYAKFLFNCNKNEIKLILESADRWLVEDFILKMYVKKVAREGCLSEDEVSITDDIKNFLVEQLHKEFSSQSHHKELK